MTTYYVSSEIGSDKNAGTSASAPLATLQDAANLVKPGDTVLVMNGTYTGPGYGDVLDITTSGTASAPITFEAAPGATPVIDSSGTWNGINIQASYIVVQGFTVVGDAANYTLQTALAGYSTGNVALDGNGIGVTAPTSAGVSHITIANNTVYNEPGGGIYTENADYVQILNNVVYNNAHWSAFGNSGISVQASVNSDKVAGVHITISGNLSFDNAQLVPTIGSGIVLDGEGIILDTNPGFAGEMLVQNNTVYGNGGPGIESYLTANAVITGNTVYGNNTQHVQAAANGTIFINQSSNNTVTNNITTAPGSPPPTAPVISSDTVSGFAPATVTLKGAGQANSTITIFDNSVELGTTIVNSSGAWTFTTAPLANGSQSFTATATDGAGQVSPLSSPLVVPLNVATNLVANGSFATGDLTSWSLGGNYTNSTVGKEIFVVSEGTGGSANAVSMGSMVTDGTLTQTVATTPGQSYTLTFWLQNDSSSSNDFSAIWNGQKLLSLSNAAKFGYTEYTYTVTASGSTSTLQFSAKNDPSEFLLDNISLTTGGTSSGGSSGSAPAAPTIAKFSPDTGVVGDGITDASTLTLTGTADPNSTVTVYDGSNKLGTTTASSTGSWDYITAVLTNAKHMLTATETNSSGQTSAASAALAVTVDTVAPAAPVPTSDSIINANHVLLAGTAEANSTITVYDGNTVVGTGTTNASGAWSLTTTALSSGAHTLTETATDIAGNVSVMSNPVSAVIGASPAAPQITLFSPDTGVSGDHITDDNTPTLSGTAAANSTVKVFDGTTQVGMATASSSGQWSVTTSLLRDGTHNLTATDTDSSGHTSAASAAFSVTIDTHAPAASTIAAYSQAGVAVGSTTTQNDLVLKGTAEANGTIDIFDGGKQIGTTTVGSGGTWSFDTGSLANGSHSFTSKVIDVAGNVSAASASDAVTVTTSSTSAPKPIEFTHVSYWNHTATIQGTADAYSHIKLYDGTVPIGTVTASANGSWSLTDSHLSNSLHTIKAQEVDSTGHVVETSSGVVILGGSNTSTFTGTGGDDFMYSSSSHVSDTFVFASDFGHSTIEGFTATGRGHDTVQLSKSVFDNFATVLSHASQVGHDVVISSGSDTLKILNTKLGALSSQDFHFA